jgi:hypothetical protein
MTEVTIELPQYIKNGIRYHERADILRMLRLERDKAYDGMHRATNADQRLRSAAAAQTISDIICMIEDGHHRSGYDV